MSQRGHRHVADQPAGIAEPLDERRRGCARVNPRQRLGRAAANKGLRVSQQVQQPGRFVFFHPNSHQPRRLPANFGSRV